MGGPKRAIETSADDYVTACPSSLRPVVEALRRLVASVVPRATEKVSYGILCFQHHYLLVGIGTTKSAVSFHVMNPRLVASMRDELAGIPHSGATLHFSPELPLPVALLTDLIRKRMQENELRAAAQRVPRNSAEHRAVALEAAKKAAAVLPLFERGHPDDPRPRRAIEAISAWAKGERVLGMAEVRSLSLASHAAAREATDLAAQFAARAAGHAVATWHVPSHAEGAATYAARALDASTAETSTSRRQAAGKRASRL